MLHDESINQNAEISVDEENISVQLLLHTFSGIVTYENNLNKTSKKAKQQHNRGSNNRKKNKQYL